ncbi:MAG TPA: ABC transporter substrate-binding protein [Candidatus Udaeobacter sp.]|jgi:ABC-type nitrate/sulfonate/bicarbonate transport system substrate-binding protein|nr:ABC transporter substrate-binding protein [Candidatus Udaeobacter sp.]
MKKKISLIVETGLILALFFGHQTASGEKLRVALPAKSLTFLNFYVGESFGAYQSEGFEISLEQITPRVGIAGMLSGEIDYTGAIGSALRAAATGVPVKALMFTMDKVLLFMLAKPEFKSIKDLKGRRNIVAVTDTAATPAFAAIAMARAHGMDPAKDFVLVSVGTVSTALAALQTGSADVAILSLPFNFKAEEAGFRNLGSAVDYMQSAFAGVAATESKMKSNPSQVKRMLRATVKSVQQTKDPANRERVIKLIAKEFNMDTNTAARSLDETIKALSDTGIMPDDAVKSELEELQKRLKAKTQMPTTRLVDYSLLKEALAEMKR